MNKLITKTLSKLKKLKRQTTAEETFQFSEIYISSKVIPEITNSFCGEMPNVRLANENN